MGLGLGPYSSNNMANELADDYNNDFAKLISAGVKFQGKTVQKISGGYVTVILMGRLQIP